MKPYLIFDYDGVIINSRDSWLSSFQETMKKMGISASMEEVLAHVGPKTEAVIESFLPENEKHRKWEGKKIIDQIVSTKGLEKANLCPNAKEVLRELKKAGYKMSLLTNSDGLFVYPSLDKFGIHEKLWDLIITADDIFTSKENSIKFISKVYGLEKNNTFYIADKTHDVEVARNTGVKSIIVSNEFSWEKEEDIKKENPDFLIKDLKELSRILEP